MSDSGDAAGACTEPQELPALISQPRTLRRACSPYHITTQTDVQATLTIEAGVHVRFGDGAVLRVKDTMASGTAWLEANGTDIDQVIFEPDAPTARLGYIELGTENVATSRPVLHALTVRTAGARAYTSPSVPRAAIVLSGRAPYLFDHVQITDVTAPAGSQAFGVAITTAGAEPDGTVHGGFARDSVDVIFTHTGDGPVWTHFAPLTTLPTLTIVSASGAEHIAVSGTDPINFTARLAPQSLNGQHLPIAFTNEPLNILPTSNDTAATVTIASHNVLQFAPTAALLVGGNQNAAANLVADGDVTFDELTPGGGWRGIHLHGTADMGTTLRGVTVAHAGGIQGYAAAHTSSPTVFPSVVVEAANHSWPVVQNVTIRDANAPMAPAVSACLGGRHDVSNPVMDYGTGMGNTFMNCGGGGPFVDLGNTP